MPPIEVRYLEGKNVRAMLPPGATHPRVEIADEFSILAARIRRVFPLSHSDGFYSIQDGAGKEVGILKSLSDLDKGSRAILEKELARRYFTPLIESIESLRQDGGMWKFNVRTQRGPAQFYVRNWRDSSHEISHMRFQILSVDGQRFEIRDYTQLDERSKSLLDQLF